VVGAVRAAREVITAVIFGFGVWALLVDGYHVKTSVYHPHHIWSGVACLIAGLALALLPGHIRRRLEDRKYYQPRPEEYADWNGDGGR
jgi:hypothetical protein